MSFCFPFYSVMSASRHIPFHSTIFYNFMEIFTNALPTFLQIKEIHTVTLAHYTQSQMYRHRASPYISQYKDMYIPVNKQWDAIINSYMTFEIIVLGLVYKIFLFSFRFTLYNTKQRERNRALMYIEDINFVISEIQIQVRLLGVGAVSPANCLGGNRWANTVPFRQVAQHGRIGGKFTAQTTAKTIKSILL